MTRDLLEHCTQLAKVPYLGRAEAKQAARTLGLRSVEVFEYERSGLVIERAVVGQRGTDHVVVVMGTNPEANGVANWIQNVDTELVPAFPGAIARVHRGFKTANDHLLAAGLEPRPRCLIVGHSKGGAQAELLAHRWTSSTVTVVTFGAPRPGDDTFASQVRARTDAGTLRVMRVVHAFDPVPWVPLARHGFVDCAPAFTAHTPIADRVLAVRDLASRTTPFPSLIGTLVLSYHDLDNYHACIRAGNYDDPTAAQNTTLLSRGFAGFLKVAQAATDARVAALIHDVCVSQFAAATTTAVDARASR